MNWSLLQYGIGIDLQAGRFTALCVKRQWRRIHLVDRLEIPDYQAAGPQECGRLYKQFLRKNGLKVPWTVVALPRSAVLLRWLNLPAAAENDVGQAVRLQLDSLHPFEEDAVCWDFTALRTPWKVFRSAPSIPGGERIEVPVAIAARTFVEETAAWFQQAGIGVSQFTVTSASLLSVIGSHIGTPSRTADGNRTAIFVLHAGPDAIEVLGYTPGSLVCFETTAAGGANPSSETIAAVRRQLELARSELRLDPEQRPLLVLCGHATEAFDAALEQEPFERAAIERLFPMDVADAVEQPHESSGSHLRDDAIAFCAALQASDRSLPFSLNLLPPENRSYQSPLIYLPAYGLAGLILALCIALGVRGTFQDWRYEKYLDRQIQSLQPRLQKVESSEEQSRKAYERLAWLSSAKSTAALPLEVLNELTRILPGDVWLQLFQFDGETISLAGNAKSASPLLETLANSSFFESPQFLSAISKSADGKEIFRISVRLRKTR